MNETDDGTEPLGEAPEVTRPGQDPLHAAAKLLESRGYAVVERSRVVETTGRLIVDIGSDEPRGAHAAETLCPMFEDEYGGRLSFGRTHSGQWKTYLQGKTYMSWDEMLRRFGPLAVETDG
ncbi:hypothetical protein [Mycobacteroides abscessus]|uniref:hypothetical protein n=1 Tax=Mycobacteroides abscessus TaxID=36809 RepID=UPI000941333D|nr:hypothetical protein [Mycobacteroides abscessus]MDO3312369.1 hypothetical protein [Mycobacteroides abscessus subsp. abscessus]MDO3344949.1 hypothetical protein [Mycobacteroides abscessus subsp. abscessus]